MKGDKNMNDLNCVANANYPLEDDYDPNDPTPHQYQKECQNPEFPCENCIYGNGTCEYKN